MRDEKTIHIRKPGSRPDIHAVNEVIDKVVHSDGDLCIALSGRVGATPYLRPTPYPNHRGTIVRMWSCISNVPKAMPGKTLLFGRREPVWPDERDDYNVNIYTTEWVWDQVRKSRMVDVVPVEESPWVTDWYDWNWENRNGGDESC